MFLISNSEEFKDAVSMHETFASFANQDELASPSHPIPFANGDVSSTGTGIEGKEFHFLLDKVNSPSFLVLKI